MTLLIVAVVLSVMAGAAMTLLVVGLCRAAAEDDRR